MKKRELIRINFEEVLSLKHNIGGFVARITEPKGLKITENGRVRYELKTDISRPRDEHGYVEVIPGIYEVCDVCKWSSQDLQWNFYLVVVSSDGKASPVAEYLDSPNTMWVKGAIKIVKAYFNGEELEKIEPTPQPKPKKVENKFAKGFMNKPVKGKPRKSEQSESAEHTESTQDKPQVSKKKTVKENHTEPKKTSKKPSGRSQEKTPLEYGYARLMTFTGMVVGVYKITRHSSKLIEVQTNKGPVKFSKVDGRQIDAEKPRYANKIEWNLSK